jgi:hypothetical protein
MPGFRDKPILLPICPDSAGATRRRAGLGVGLPSPLPSLGGLKTGDQDDEERAAGAGRDLARPSV